jgi:subtilisin family serine protease
MIKIILFIFMVTLVSCLETPEPSNSNSNSTNNSPYSPQAAINYNADVTGLQGIDFVFDTKSRFTESISSGFSFTISNKPSFLSFNTTTGVLSGEPTENGKHTSIIITATNIADSNIQFVETFSLAINGDPLRAHAWHIKNTSQNNFANRSGTAGVDINVSDVYKDNITGRGVKLAFSDSGVEINHDDLYLNGITGAHRDYSLNSPYVGDPIATNAHGTAVAGIANAVGWNNHGSIGVAPNAKFAGFQFLDSSQSTSILLHQASGDFDIFNYSYGDTLYYPTFSDPDYIDHLRSQTINSNKVYVKAAGNEHARYSDDFKTCVSHNANFPFENESPFLIVVGALDADGYKSTYSNAGSNLWVTAPGGEFGESSNGGDPAIMTTDLPTCFKGFSKASSSQINSFEYGHNLNSSCHYTSTMNGTSSAVPVVTGVIALLREANSSLKMRHIKHILASTAVKTDPTHSNLFRTNHLSKLSGSCNDLSLTGHAYELGWVTNKAGFSYNNFYGFGLVDAKAAVNLAKTYNINTLGTLSELNPNFNNASYGKTGLNLTIPNDDTSPYTQSINAAGIKDTINVATSLTLETVQLKISIVHPKPGEIGIELKSPEGTTSILQNINNSFLLGNKTNLGIVLSTNAFYGEESSGTWELRVIDGQTGASSGYVNSWHLNILGH